MKLPFLYNAIVPVTKITGYLLNLEHRDGASKARFFYRFGFAIERPRELMDALLDHARAYDVSEWSKDEHGVRFIIRGPLSSPDGRNPWTQSVWQIKHGDNHPRLIAAYPIRRRP